MGQKGVILSMIVIVTGNGIGNQSSNLKIDLVSHSADG